MYEISEKLLDDIKEIAEKIIHPYEMRAFTITYNQDVDERPIITVVGDCVEKTEYLNIAYFREINYASDRS